VRATRYIPVDTLIVAAAPTLASGDAASIAMVSVRPTSVPETDGSDGAELGEVLLPPHAGRTAPTAKSATTWQVRAQNSRRVDDEGV